MLNTAPSLTSAGPGRAIQKVVVVNGSREMLELLESVLDGGHFDTVFVADSEHAYSQIKQNRPNLVVVCVGVDDLASFSVLSMLKLDPETATIPVLTFTNEFENGASAQTEPSDEERGEEAEEALSRTELSMN
jgi:PleD family two-component response regulator